VSASAQRTNFGKKHTLTVDARPLRRAYLRFNIDLSRGHVSRVNLLLYSRRPLRLGYQVRLVTMDWRERLITYRNAPRISSRFVSSGPLRARAWKAVDITSLVGIEESDINLALTTVAPAGIVFASRESGLTGPRIVVEQTENGKGRNPTEPPPPPLAR
jgi:hypothetical protein